MEFLGNFFPKILCSNLFSKLFEIGEKWLKHPLTVLAVFKKGSNSNFLEQNTIFFFVNDARFARKHGRTYSKLVGTPSIYRSAVFTICGQNSIDAAAVIES